MSVDGELQLEVNDPEIATGSVGARVCYSSLYLDDIYVERLDGIAPTPSPERCNVLVADFDSGTALNNLDLLMGEVYGPPNKLEVEYVEEPNRGRVARLHYSVREWSAFWSRLPYMDLNAFDYLLLDIRRDLQSAMPGKVRVELKRKEGKEISKPLASSGLFPPVVVNMIAVGEKSGQLEEMLNSVSKIVEAELDSSLKRLMSLLEPIMILCVGAIAAFIVISILLPIFEMNQLIK